jgi:hypothetical protein
MAGLGQNKAYKKCLKAPKLLYFISGLAHEYK